MKKTIGIIAGIGKLPVECAKSLKADADIRVVAFAVLPDTDAAIAAVADAFYKVNLANMADFFQTLKREGIAEVIMLGKVTKELLFHKSASVQLDGLWQKLLGSLPNMNDDTIMMAIVGLFEQYGVKVLDQTSAVRFLLPTPGILTERTPSEKECIDMEYALEMAKASASLDIGQSVVVKDRAVMAIEAVEGTNECIKRGGMLAGGNGAVVGKVAKPKQDLRFDVPTVGAETVKAMIAAGIKALVIEAGKTFLLEKEEVLRLANENGIVIKAQDMMKDK